MKEGSARNAQLFKKEARGSHGQWGTNNKREQAQLLRCVTKVGKGSEDYPHNKGSNRAKAEKKKRAGAKGGCVATVDDRGLVKKGEKERETTKMKGTIRSRVQKNTLVLSFCTNGLGLLDRESCVWCLLCESGKKAFPPLHVNIIQLTSTNDLNLNSLLCRLVEATLVGLGGFDGGGEQGVDERGLAETRFT